MDPATIAAYLELAGQLTGIVNGVIAKLRAAGVSDEQLAAITLDYDARIAQRQTDADQG